MGLLHYSCDDGASTGQAPALSLKCMESVVLIARPTLHAAGIGHSVYSDLT